MLNPDIRSSEGIQILESLSSTLFLATKFIFQKFKLGLEIVYESYFTVWGKYTPALIIS